MAFGDSNIHESPAAHVQTFPRGVSEFAEKAELNVNAFYSTRSTRHPVGAGHLRLPNVTAHFKRMQERASVKKVLAYEKKSMKYLPRRPKATIELHRHTRFAEK